MEVGYVIDIKLNNLINIVELILNQKNLFNIRYLFRYFENILYYLSNQI